MTWPPEEPGQQDNPWGAPAPPPSGPGPGWQGGGPAWQQGPPPGYPPPGYPPPGYPPPGYPPPGPSWAPRQATPGGQGMGVAALVLGIVSVVAAITAVGGVLLGLAALALGSVAARRTRRLGLPGHGKAVAGIVLGSLGLVLGGALLAVVIGAVVHGHLIPCLRHAGGNRAAIRRCDRIFRRRLGG